MVNMDTKNTVIINIDIIIISMDSIDCMNKLDSLVWIVWIVAFLNTNQMDCEVCFHFAPIGLRSIQGDHCDKHVKT